MTQTFLEFVNDGWVGARLLYTHPRLNTHIQWYGDKSKTEKNISHIVKVFLHLWIQTAGHCVQAAVSFNSLAPELTCTFLKHFDIKVVQRLLKMFGKDSLSFLTCSILRRHSPCCFTWLCVDVLAHSSVWVMLSPTYLSMCERHMI